MCHLPDDGLHEHRVRQEHDDRVVEPDRVDRLVHWHRDTVAHWRLPRRRSQVAIASSTACCCSFRSCVTANSGTFLYLLPVGLGTTGSSPAVSIRWTVGTDTPSRSATSV